MLSFFISQGIETQRGESRAIRNGSGESQEGAVTGMGGLADLEQRRQGRQ